MAFVLDASVALRWLMKDGTESDLAYANFVLDQFLDSNIQVHVPSHWPLEITNVMLRSERLTLINQAASETFLDMIRAAPVNIDMTTAEQALRVTLALAREFRLTPYDAAYLELALRLDCPLATLDKDLRRAAEKAGLEVL